jgi:uncharacterized protein (TIGR02145 family)
MSSSSFESTQIGNQIWMTKNLDVEKFRNGDLIPQVTSDSAWEYAGENGLPAWCYLENDSLENGILYGKLYNWHAVIDPRGLAPKGWHIPTSNEWTALTTSLGGVAFAGLKMASTSGWVNNQNGTNESGFNGLPGGGRGQFGDFYGKYEGSVWWSTSLDSLSDMPWVRYLSYDMSVYSDINDKGDGAYVRCVKD